MKKIIVVCGPTASGKTALSIELAKKFDGEIISADALLVYRGLDIGTAKPTEEEKSGIPHYLIDVVSPNDEFSVSDYERTALPILEDILSRGKSPIICGGTGFYINSLLYKSGFGGAPADENIRKKYEDICEKHGREYLHGLLKEVDPESAEKLHFNDVKRVVRALEIFELTGKKKSEQNDALTPRYPFVAFSLDFPRETLYERIDRRVDAMMENGLIEEIDGLLASGVPKTAQCMQGIGYKEVVFGRENGEDIKEIVELIKKNTRNYAKRQLTFFKRMENLHYLSPELKTATEEAVKIYEQD